MKKIGFLLTIIIAYSVIFLVFEYKNSFKSVEEVLISKDGPSNHLEINQIIGGSEYGNKAFYFFLNNENKVVGVRLDKGLFGWKFNSATTGSGLEINIEQKLSKASASSSNDSHKFYFGLTSLRDVGKISINDTYQATLIRLEESLVNVRGIQNTYLWYGYFKDNSANYEVDVFDTENKLQFSQ